MQICFFLVFLGERNVQRRLTTGRFCRIYVIRVILDDSEVQLFSASALGQTNDKRASAVKGCVNTVLDTCCCAGMNCWRSGPSHLHGVESFFLTASGKAFAGARRADATGERACRVEGLEQGVSAWALGAGRVLALCTVTLPERRTRGASSSPANCTATRAGGPAVLVFSSSLPF